MTLHRALRITTIVTLFVATGLLLGIALLQAAGGGSEPETILACVKVNGQITLLSPVPEGGADPREGCRPGQILIEWNVVGPEGLQGIPGTPGAVGPQGLEGTPGTPGDVGPEGPAGPEGLDGATGSPGNVGQEGPEGPAGPRGSDGATGTPGMIGPRGLQGLDGDTGTPGTIGPQGPQGLDGATGTPGTIGPQGPAGPAGSQGLDGATGTPGVVGQQGPAGPQGLYGATGTPGAVGPRGLQGLDGDTGAPGAIGQLGPVGPAGPQGPEGSPGPAADLSAVQATFDELDARISALEQNGTSSPPVVDLHTQVLDILGINTAILPIGDFDFSDADSTFTTRGNPPLTFEWSEPLASFDTPTSIQGSVPIVAFNGLDEEADTSDDAFWTRTTSAFSVGAWIRPSAAGSAVLAKWDTGTGDREWQFLMNSAGDINLVIFDETNNATIGRYVDTPLAFNEWVFVVGRYDGGTDAANIDIFRNGVEADDRNHSDSAAFASMVDGGTPVTLGHRLGSSGPNHLFNGEMAGGTLGPFFIHRELSASEIQLLFLLGQEALGL